MKFSQTYAILFRMGIASEKAGNSRVTAMITKGKHIISFGANSMKTSPWQKRFGRNDLAICLHAEIDAIKNALKVVSVRELKNCNLFVCRVKQNKPRGDFVAGLAMPCSGCQKAIVTFKINNVYYTEDNVIGFRCL